MVEFLQNLEIVFKVTRRGQSLLRLAAIGDLPSPLEPQLWGSLVSMLSTS